MVEAWAPGLSDVAKHIPARTRDKSKPGQDVMLRTFNANTTPNDADVQQRIDDAVSALIGQVGELPAQLTESAEVADMARTAVEFRVAADIELAYPNRDADLITYDRLDRRAQLAMQQLTAALALAAGGGGYTPDLLPQWAFPDPPPWGDTSPGSGTEFVVSGRTLPPGMV
jgi:hypothetical protein